MFGSFFGFFVCLFPPAFTSRFGCVQKVGTSNVTSLRRRRSFNTVVTNVEVQDTDFLDTPICPSLHRPFRRCRPPQSLAPRLVFPLTYLACCTCTAVITAESSIFTTPQHTMPKEHSCRPQLHDPVNRAQHAAPRTVQRAALHRSAGKPSWAPSFCSGIGWLDR